MSGGKRCGCGNPSTCQREGIGPVNAEVARPNLTPTPVPSEADPGAGEREHHRSGDECDPWCPATFPHRTTPATPDTGDWAHCHCGWQGRLWMTTCGAHLEFGQHLTEDAR